MRKVNVIHIHDLPSDTPGKTRKEANLEKKHNIPVGALVEVVDSWDKWNGVRLFVVRHSRDCDGTPLYNLCFDKTDTEIEKEGFYNSKWMNGISEECLKLIRSYLKRA